MLTLFPVSQFPGNTKRLLHSREQPLLVCTLFFFVLLILVRALIRLIPQHFQ